jgi:hypothetical protein
MPRDLPDGPMPTPLEQELDLRIARTLAIYLRCLDAADFAQLLGACQAEATVRGWRAVIGPLGEAHSAAQQVTDVAGRR